MKKLFIIFVSVTMVSFMSYTAFAASWSSSTLTVNGATVNLSNNVYGDYVTSSDNSTYSAATYNSKGTKVYGSASDMSVIDSKSCAATPCGTTEKDPLSNGNSKDVTGSGWSAL